MDEREILTTLENKLTSRIEDNLIEAYALIENYIRAYSYKENALSNMEARDVRYLINSYFKQIDTRFIPDLSYNLHDIFRKLDLKLEETKDINEINHYLSDDLVEMINDDLRGKIVFGLQHFDEDFFNDFMKEIIPYTRVNSRYSDELYDIVRMFKNNLLIKVEEIMEEFRLQTKNYAQRLINEAKEEYKKGFKEDKSLENERKEKAKEAYLNKLQEIHNKYEKEISENEVLAQKFNDLNGFFKLLISQNTDFTKLTKKQNDRLLLLLLEFSKELNRIQEKEKQSKTDTALSKMKSMKQEEKTSEKALPQYNETEVINADEIDLEQEKQRIINAKHFTDEQKQRYLQELEDEFGQNSKLI